MAGRSRVLASFLMAIKFSSGKEICCTVDEVMIKASLPDRDLLVLRMTTGPLTATSCSMDSLLGRKESWKPFNRRTPSSVESYSLLRRWEASFSVGTVSAK